MLQSPPLQESAPSQRRPSSQLEASGSAAVQLSAFSLQLSAQSRSPSGPGQGLPAWALQSPLLHWSAPLQNTPSSQAEPFGSGAVHLSLTSLQDSMQLPSPS